VLKAKLILIRTQNFTDAQQLLLRPGAVANHSKG
jgi:hypothetical protein